MELKGSLPAPRVVASLPFRRLRHVGLVLLGSLIVWFVLTAAPAAAPLRRGVVGGLLLLNVLSSYLSDSRLEIASLFTPAPTVEERVLLFGEERLRLTVFGPGEGEPRGGVLLVNGAVELGNEDPAIRRVASSLARSGFLVGLPELESFRAFRIDAEDPARIAAAFAHLRADPILSGRPVGLVGFCFGASIALVVASDAAVANQVAFVAGAIPYARFDALVVDVLSRSAEGSGGTRQWEPRDDLVANLPPALVGLLSDQADREALLTLADAGQLADSHANLSPAAEGLRRLLMARERGEAEALLAEQDPALRTALANLSPLPQLAGLRAPLFLYHGEGDRVIPWEHSAALAEAAPSPTRLEVSALLQHTRLVLDPRQWRLMLGYPREAWDLLVWLNALLATAGLG